MDESCETVWEDHLEAVGRRRDAAAFGALFAHFAPRVKSIILRSGVSAEMAEEIAQETFIAVWRRASTYDPAKASAAAWIFTVARNKRIDRLRKETRQEPDPDDPAFAPDPPESAEAAMTGQERATRVRAVISELPEAQRDVLVRSYFAEKTHVEIARELDAPLGTVKSRLRMAMARVRAALEEDGLEDGS